MQPLQVLGIELVVTHPLQYLSGEVSRCNPIRLQCPQTLSNDASGDYRTGDNRQHQPAARLHDLYHEGPTPLRNGLNYNAEACVAPE